MIFIDEYTFMSVGQFPLFMMSQAVLLLSIVVGSVVVMISVVGSVVVTISVVNGCLNDYIMVGIYNRMQDIFWEKFMLNNIYMGRLVVLLN